MTDKEFEIIDELYFVTSFGELESSLTYDKEELLGNLKELVSKNWIRVYGSPEEELELGQAEKLGLEKCYFLASKEGLFVHNRQ